MHCSPHYSKATRRQLSDDLIPASFRYEKKRIMAETSLKGASNTIEMQPHERINSTISAQNMFAGLVLHRLLSRSRSIKPIGGMTKLCATPSVPIRGSVEFS